MTDLLERTDEKTEPICGEDGSSDLVHIYCDFCDPYGEKAYCGYVFSSNAEDLGEYEDDTEDACIVCIDLSETHECYDKE